MKDNNSASDNGILAQVASAVFFPRPDMPFGPEATGAYDHMFDVEPGVRIRLRVFPAGNTAPIILFFHGNGETARDYDPVAEEYGRLPASFIIGEYRGYGPCSGTPSIDNFLSDAHSCLDEMKKVLLDEGHTGPVVIMGRSLGSAPAIELASARPGEIAGLIIESGFANMLPLLELLGIPARSLGLTEEHGPRNFEKMQRISMPTLIMHAEMDQIIPVQEAETLFDACLDSQKVFYRVPGAGHNDIQFAAGRSYFSHIANLLKRIKS